MNGVAELLRNSGWFHHMQGTATRGQAVLGICMEQKLSGGGV